MSYGVADDVGTDRRIIYFDLPRLSPLQFNVTFPEDAGEQDVTRRIKHAVVARMGGS